MYQRLEKHCCSFLLSVVSHQEFPKLWYSYCYYTLHILWHHNCQTRKPVGFMQSCFFLMVSCAMCPVVSTWKPHSCPHGNHVVYTWKPISCGVQMSLEMATFMVYMLLHIGYMCFRCTLHVIYMAFLECGLKLAWK